MTPLPLVRVTTALAVVVGVLAAIGVALPLQPVLGAAFVLWVPGAAVVTLIPLDDAIVASALAVATSVAIVTLTAMAMLWAHRWYPGAAVVVLSAGSAVLLTRARTRRSPASQGQP